ncbi:MAG: glutathione ABC transporter permease GsiC [Ardenticatenia bacterium]|jgi:peptide/nickel transport system permease protein|nr:MAG: glutathione ABC transporter permease GsiC [Ardenticatenia bacterium]
MTRYVVQRVLSLIPVLIGVTLLVFLIMQLAPGDPVKIMLGPRASEEAVNQLRRDMGLDQPMHIQYLRWLGGVLRGDWGRSIQLKREVLPYLAGRFQNSAYLMVLALSAACLVGVPAGIVSAIRQYSLGDRVAMVLVLVGFSTPVFWLGIILQIVFGLMLGILPVSGIQSPGQTGTLDLILHLILPSATLATGPMAIIARMTRSSMLEVIRQDYIRTARAKGLRERLVISRHGVRNALIPVVTVIGLQAGYLLGGDILVEMVFSYPGIGLAMVTGILARDFPIVQGAILMVASSYVLVNLITDLAYAYIDPRIHYGT